MYLYESHLGGYYSSPEYLTDDELYCEECGDSDYIVGEYDENDKTELWALLKSDASIFGTGGTTLDHIYFVLTGKNIEFEDDLVALRAIHDYLLEP